MKKFSFKKALSGESSGEIMLESAIVFTFVLFFLIGMLSMGVLFYQRAMLHTVAIETAQETASNFKYAVTEDKNGNEVKELKLYRSTLALASSKENGKAVAEKYFNERIKLTTLGTAQEAKVEKVDVSVDNIGRMHAEVTASLECDFLFSDALIFLGIIDEKPKMTSTARAECLDVTAYAGHVQFLRYVSDKVAEVDGETGGVLSKITDIIKDIKEIGDVFKGG